jgi:hypothetical protein
MGSYRAAALIGIRAAALIGILPGAIVAAAYLLVLTEQLYDHWDTSTAVVLGMAAWGVLGVVELWHDYVRLSRESAGATRTPVSPRIVLFVWALILVGVAGWRVDDRPWAAAFLALVALYSLGRAFGLLRYVRRSADASPRASDARPSRRARARRGERVARLHQTTPGTRR